MKSQKYEKRFYRDWHKSDDMVSFNVNVSESDLYISAGSDLSKEAREYLLHCRYILESYIKNHEEFLKSFKPVDVEPLAHPLIRSMADASLRANVGPMASVAGAVSQFVGNELLKHSKNVIVENGGDVFLKSETDRKIALYMGEKLSVLNVIVKSHQTPCGICTSSSIMGHSQSFGKADSVTIFSTSAILADALATAVCNETRSSADIEKNLDYALSIDGVFGVIIAVESKIGIKGDVILG